MHSSDSVVPVPNSRPTSGWYHNSHLLLASLTESKKRGASSMAPGLVPSPPSMSSPALIPDWEREVENRSMAPGFVPSPRHPGGCRLLLASLTGSERWRTDPWRPASCHRLVIPWSPARIPDWEREKGNFVHGSRPRAATPSSQVTMTCSFHLKIFLAIQVLMVEKAAVTVRHLLQRPTP